MVKKKNKMIIIIPVLITLVLLIQGIIYITRAAGQVELYFVPSPNIDIVLAKGKTVLDLNNFKTDMENALKARGIDISKVNITSIESQEMNLQESLKWQEDKSSTIGSIDISPDGRDVEMIGNRTKPGKNAIYILPTEDAEQSFTFEYNINFGDSFNAAGILLRVKKDGNSLTGYMLSFNKSDKNWYDDAGNNSGAIWEFRYNLNSNTSNVESKRLVCPLDIDTAGTLTVVATAEDITVSGGGLSSPVVYDLEKEFGYGYGFFSDHYSHNCDRIGSFALTGINLTNTTVKKMEEVLREPEFREDSIKALVNVQDNENKELQDTSSLGELLTRTINEEIHFIGWGTNANRTETNNFIAANNNNGMFTYNTNYTNAINATADYIKSLIDESQSTQYLILNEPIEIRANQDGILTDTENSQYPYGRWKIIHDCEYFENNIGQFADSNKYIPDMITQFDKTGKYQIYFEDQPVLPTEIYVHRRPVAEFSITRSGNRVTLTSLSYDLDSYSNNNGIAQEEWKYRKVGETTWTNGKLTDISGGNDYLVQLRVKDFQNTWSKPVSKYVTKTTSGPPIASFMIVNQTCSMYENLEVTDGSYDPAGGTITSRTWTVTKDGNQIYSGSTPLTNYRNYGTGNYTMSLVVTNNSGKVSERVSRSFTIIPDDEAPEFVADPVSCTWKTSQAVNVQFSDRLGSGFKSYQYAITDSQNTPSTWSSQIAKQTDTITIAQDGVKYLHIIARDNAGNVSEDRVLGPYNIDRTPPTGSVNHTPTSWVIDYIDLKWNFTDSKSGLARVVLPNNQQVTNTASGTYRITENGTYNFTVYDNLGNNQVISKTITNIDKTQPVIALSQRPSEWTDTETIVTWNCSDTQSGFKEVLLPDGSISNKTAGEFTTTQVGTFTFIAYDNVGNQKLASIQIQNIDKVKPKLELSQNVDTWVNADVEIEYYSTDNESGFREILLPNGELKNQQTGIYKAMQNGIYTFVAYDNVGNTEVKTIEITNIDKVNPELSLEYIEESKKIKWSTSDAESGFKEILFPNGEVSNLDTGEYEVEASGTYAFISYDNAGNMTIKTISIEI